jgi:Zn-dependent peptidase ImmA (M78 family)
MVPADDFIIDIAPTARRWEDFLRLRHKWGISAAALARRARDLGLLNADAYRFINMTRRSRGHWTIEPGDDAQVEQPTTFSAAQQILRHDAGWTDATFSETAGLPYWRLADLLPDDFPVANEPQPPVRLRLI